MALCTRFALLFGLTAALTMTTVMAVALVLFDQRMAGIGSALTEAVDDAVATQLRSDSEALLAALSRDIRADLLDYDRAALDRHARAAFDRSSADVIRIYDSFGRTLADGAGDEGAFDRPAPAALRDLRADGGVIRWEDGGRMFSGNAVCINATCVGSVAVAIDAARLTDSRARSLAATQSAREAFLWEAGLMAGLAVVLGAALAGLVGWLLGRRLMRSLKSAVRSLEGLAAGGSDIRIEAREVELRELAQAVERVAERMASAAPEQDAILADILDGLFVAEIDGRVAVANPALHDLLGEAPTALIGQDVFVRFGIAMPPGPEAQCAALGAVTQLTTADGTSRPVMLSARLGRDGGRIVGIVRDASERVETERKLLEAQMRANAAEKARSEFLAVMSHELRTPLNGVLGGAAVLAGSELSAKQRSLLGLMQASGKSLLTMVTNILDFSEVDSGKATVDLAPLDLEAVARDIAASVADAAAAKGLALRLRVQPNPPVALADHEKLVDIGRRLAENAVRFTETGHVAVDLSHRVEGDRLHVALRIADSGVGIDESDREGIFAQFTQGDSSARRSHTGAGLGLTIARRLADMMGGEIRVDSVKGEGSTFTLHLDLDLAEPGTVAAPATPLAARKALVVAPDAHERAVLMEQLGAAGAEANECETAAEAVAALARALNDGTPIDLVVHPEDLEDFDASGLAMWLRSETPAHPTASVVTRAANDAGHDAVRLLQPLPTSAQLFEAARQALAAVPASRAQHRPAAGFSVISDEPEAAVDAEAPMRVLLAESNEVNRIVLSAYLKKAGYQVDAVANGAEALAQFRLAPPNLILMDVDMPVMNGLDTSREVRRLEVDNRSAQTPIIGLAAARRAGERERCAAAGMNDHLSKPIKIDELEAKLERWTVLTRTNTDKRSLAS